MEADRGRPRRRVGRGAPRVRRSRIPAPSVQRRPFSPRSARAARVTSSGSRSDEKEVGRTRSGTSSDASTASGSGGRSPSSIARRSSDDGARPSDPERRWASSRAGTPRSRELPPGWRELLCELELDSTDYLPRAALLGAPLNPTRNPGRDRASLPRLLGRRLRHVAGNGAALPRAHRGRRDHGACLRAEAFSPRPGTRRRWARSGVSPAARSSGRSSPNRASRDDACGSQRNRSVPGRARAIFQV